MRLRVRSWAAWSPGLEARADWERWCTAPGPLAAEGVPKVDFLPAAMRRRCTRLTKMALRAAFDACDESTRSRASTVFASRHGAIHVAVKILATIARGEVVSPMQFSHSVHNAQAGLFSIAAENRRASSSIAGEEDTFGSGLLEAALMLARAPTDPVLFVTSDEPIPDNLAPLIEEPPGAYAVALVLEAASPAAPELGDTFELELRPGGGGAAGAWPHATEFLRWWIGDDAPTLELGHRSGIRLSRGPAANGASGSATA